jgi:hypothetical protein
MVKHVVLAAAIVLAAAVPAHADDGAAILGSAQKAIDDIDYESARSLTDQALATGTLRASELARAHLLAGQVEAALGNDAGARDHFARALVIGDVKLPSGQSPKITQPFEAARAQVKALGPARLAFDVAREREVTVVTVINDPLHLVASVHASLAPGGDSEEVGSRMELHVAQNAAAVATITLRDDHGNELVTRTEKLEAQALTATATTSAPTTETTHSLPAAVRWPTWAGVAVVGGVAAVYFSYKVGKDKSDLDALNASSSMHSFDEARAIEDRGRKDSLFTNVSIGITLAAVAAAVVTYAIDDTHVVEVRPVASPGAAGASVAIRF